MSHGLIPAHKRGTDAPGCFWVGDGNGLLLEQDRLRFVTYRKRPACVVLETRRCVDVTRPTYGAWVMRGWVTLAELIEVVGKGLRTVGWRKAPGERFVSWPLGACELALVRLDAWLDQGNECAPDYRARRISSIALRRQPHGHGLDGSNL